MNKEKQFTIGVVKRFNNFFGPWDLEIEDYRGRNYWSDCNKYYNVIKKMKWRELEKETNWILYCIKLWRKETKKDWGLEEYINFLIG